MIHWLQMVNYKSTWWNIPVYLWSQVLGYRARQTNKLTTSQLSVARNLGRGRFPSALLHHDPLLQKAHKKKIPKVIDCDSLKNEHAATLWLTHKSWWPLTTLYDFMDTSGLEGGFPEGANTSSYVRMMSVVYLPFFFCIFLNISTLRLYFSISVWEVLIPGGQPQL